MEVIVTSFIVSWLVYNLLTGCIQPTYIGMRLSMDPKYQQDIPVAYSLRRMPSAE